jgi:hypothetical protein
MEYDVLVVLINQTYRSYIHLCIKIFPCFLKANMLIQKSRKSLANPGLALVMQLRSGANASSDNF